jgi:ABC transporter substrate binding protein
MTRVWVVATLTLALLAAPPAAEAQRVGKVARLGFLSNISPNADLRDAFREGLRELGYKEGQNLLVEYRSAEGHYERLPDLAAELVRLNVDVIVATGTPAPNAAKRATSTIPIIITNHSDARHRPARSAWRRAAALPGPRGPSGTWPGPAPAGGPPRPGTGCRRAPSGTGLPWPGVHR